MIPKVTTKAESQTARTEIVDISFAKYCCKCPSWVWMLQTIRAWMIIWSTVMFNEKTGEIWPSLMKHSRPATVRQRSGKTSNLTANLTLDCNHQVLQNYMMFPLVLYPIIWGSVQKQKIYCFICGPRRMAVARYRMISLVLLSPLYFIWASMFQRLRKMFLRFTLTVVGCDIPTTDSTHVLPITRNNFLISLFCSF